MRGTGTHQWKGKRKVEISEYFITNYAKVSYVEMYAEMFAHWLFGELNGQAKEWFEELH